MIPAQPYCRVKQFVGGIGNISSEEFKAYWRNSSYPVISSDVVRRPDGTSRGFGFVTFADEASGQQAIAQQHSVGGRQWDLKSAVPRGAEVWF